MSEALQSVCLVDLKQKHQSKDSPSRVPQPLTFPSTDSPPTQSSLIGDHADVDLLCSTPYSRHGVPKSPTETSYKDRNTTTAYGPGVWLWLGACI